MEKRTRNHPQPECCPTKRLKVDADGIKEERATTIVDLNDDCLTEVFNYLNKSDLLNVSVLDPRLRDASEGAFSRNFAKKQTIVSTVPGSQQNAYEINNSIRLVQTFGPLMTKVLVMFKLHNIAEILESMVEKCGENLNELELRDFGGIILYSQGVEKMNLFLGGLNEQFPNLRRLKLDYCNTSKKCKYFKILIRPIPSLRSFSVCGFALEDIRQFIRLNGQLESLSLVGPEVGPRSCLYISQDFINDVDLALPQLKNVEFSHAYIFEPYEGKNKNRFQNVKKLSIGPFAIPRDGGGDLFPFAGKNIGEICAHFNVIDDDLRDFAEKISQFKQLRRLDLQLTICYSFVTGAINSQTVEGLRSISNNKQLMGVVVQLYRKNFNFTSIALRPDHQFYKTIESAFIESQWNVNKDSNRMVLTKDRQN